MITGLERFLSPDYHTGTECDASVRAERAQSKLDAAKTALASGQYLVKYPSGEMGLMDPAYFTSSFRPMRWMTPEDIASVRRVSSMQVGETLNLAERFHPRHGVKRRAITRIA